MIKRIKKAFNRALLIGGLTIAGASFYSGETLERYLEENSSNISSFELNDSLTREYAKLISKNYFETLGKTTTFEKAKAEYEAYQKSELEKILEKDKINKEKEKWEKGFYLSPDSLNLVIKQAYDEMKKEGKKWPAEFDKRLFRLMLRQESRYNVYAVSPVGYMGLGQVGFSMVETLRPEKWNKEFKDPLTGKVDSLAVKRYLFDPVENIKLSLEGLTFFSNYCKKNVQNWKGLDLDEKRRITLSCYNAGNGTMKNVNFDYNSPDLPKETRDHHEKIMNAYYNPKVQVKI